MKIHHLLTISLGLFADIVTGRAADRPNIILVYMDDMGWENQTKRHARISTTTGTPANRNRSVSAMVAGSSLWRRGK